MKTQQPLHVATPVRQSLALTKVAGTSVYLKLDSSQPTGSFKIRGIGHLCKTVSNSPSVPWWCDGVICPVATTCGFKILDCDFSFWISPVGRARMWAFCLLFRWAAKKKKILWRIVFPSVDVFRSLFISSVHNRRKCWHGSCLFCPSAWGSCNYRSAKCHPKPHSGETEGRGCHRGHPWKG